jgi:hypothetical protein
MKTHIQFTNDFRIYNDEQNILFFTSPWPAIKGINRTRIREICEYWKETELVNWHSGYNVEMVIIQYKTPHVSNRFLLTSLLDSFSGVTHYRSHGPVLRFPQISHATSVREASDIYALIRMAINQINVLRLRAKGWNPINRFKPTTLLC